MNIHCDTCSAINIIKNHVFHYRTKHIEIRHHFIRDLVEKKVISLDFIPTEHQLADILTKPLDSLWFEFLRKSLSRCLIDWSSRVISLKGVKLICFIVCFLLAFFCLVWSYDFCLFTWYISVLWMGYECALNTLRLSNELQRKWLFLKVCGWEKIS